MACRTGGKEGARESAKPRGLGTSELRAGAPRGAAPRRPRTFHDEVRLTLAAVGHDLIAPLILHRHFREDEDVALPILLEAVPGLEGILPGQFHAIFQPGGRGK